MPKNVTIPVTDDAICACTSFYQIKYSYGSLPLVQENFMSPLPMKILGSPATSTPYIEILNLVDGQTYSYYITRFCSNGSISSVVSGTFNT